MTSSEADRGAVGRIDFDALAADVVAAGLFGVDEAAVAANRRVTSAHARLPATLLDAPYGNGPIAIRILRQDVPEVSVYAVRRNFTEANNLLVDTDRMMLYFHQRFVSDDVFRSKSLAALVAEYRAPRVDPAHDASVDAALGTTAKPDELSFRIEGVDRATHDRRLYTLREQLAALELVRAHPEAVLTILAYQAVVLDFLVALTKAIANLAASTPSEVTPKDLADLGGYVNQWRTNNFTDELIPAMAIFHQQHAAAGEPEASIDAALFEHAVEFIVSNGAFRNWVTVPADVASDGEAHLDHFLCPAVGLVRAQLLEGGLLGRIHTILVQKRQRGDRLVKRFCERISADATEKYEDRDRGPSGVDRERVDEPLRVRLDGRDHEVVLDAPFAVFMSGRQARDDVVLELPHGTLLHVALRSAVSEATERDQPVAFQFNGRGYRITTEKLRQLLAMRGESAG